MKTRLLIYLNSDRHLWWTVTIIPGIYSILYLYTNNFTLVNSWYQLLMCFLAFVLLPVAEILILDAVFKKWLPNWRPHLYWTYLIINFAIILSLTIYLGWRWKALILISFLAIVSSFFLGKHYKKGVLLIGLMTVSAAFQFTYFYVERVLNHKTWVQKTDFEEFKFQKKPNIYVIQPDGFVGKMASNNKYYDLDLEDFYRSLDSLGFTTNADYRSNYPSTLSSNTTLFTGQHHYFENGNMENELLGAREIITGQNPVLNTMKKNGYKTHLILQHAYLIMNFPDIAYDYVNISKSEISAPIPDYHVDKDFMADFEATLFKQDDSPQFYFVEILEPGHIPNYTKAGQEQQEANTYKKDLYRTAQKLKKLAALINAKDPEGIILILADHGGFVGLSKTMDAYKNLTNDTAIKESIYSALLAIKAPKDFDAYQENIKSSVGVFPNLFAYLAGKSIPKDSLDDSSYIFIKKGENRGVYKYFNSNGKPVTEKIQL